MTTLASSAGGNSTISGLAGLMHQRRQDFKSMENEVKSGNIQGAQSAMAAWQLDMQNIQKLAGASNPVGSQVTSPFQNDLSAFTNAIKSGNIGSSQSTLAKLQQDRQNVSASTGVSQTSAEFLSDLQSMLKGVQATNPTSAPQNTASVQNALNSITSAKNSVQDNSFSAYLANLQSSGKADLAGANTGNSLLNSTGSSSSIHTAAQAAYSMIMKLQAGSNFNSLA